MPGIKEKLTTLQFLLWKKGPLIYIKVVLLVWLLSGCRSHLLLQGSDPAPHLCNGSTLSFCLWPHFQVPGPLCSEPSFDLRIELTGMQSPLVRTVRENGFIWMTEGKSVHIDYSDSLDTAKNKGTFTISQ